MLCDSGGIGCFPLTTMASATVRSRSSGSSASSLSSTFSDITCATDLSASSSPPGAKTNAFFASPFNTRPPSPTPTPPAPSPPRSLTADFFATPVKPPSPPASTSPRKHTQHSQIHASRIFPSRYTTESTRSPEFSLLSLDELAPHTYQPPPTYHSHARTPSDGSEDSIAFASPISSIFAQPRLPTPPPPPTPAQKRPAVLHREDTIIPPRSRPVDDQPLDEHTPRPPSREPGLLHFERSLLLARQAEAQAEVHKRSHPPDHGHNDIEEPDEEEEDEELKEGSIITLPPMTSFAYTSGLSPPPVRAAPLPISPLALAFTLPDPTLQSPPDRGTRTPKPMGDPSDALPSGPDSPGAAVFSPYLHPQYDGSHPPPATSSLPSPLPLSRSPSGTALALSTSSSSSSISGQHGQAYTQSPITTVPASQLRLLRPLGHGAFSTVWLAEDLSKVPLTLVSKKSVRDLRRRASGRDGGERERDVLREKERARRARDRESTRTPEPVPTLHNAAKETTDDTPRPPAARSPKSIRGLVDPIPLPTPLQSASASQASIVPTITTVPPPPPPPPPKSPHRQSSRIREGLRSMLAFSRGAGAALASAGSHPHPHPSGANVDVETKASNLRGHTDDAGILHRLVVHSPHSSEGSLSVASTASVSHPAAMDVKDAHSESPTHMHNEADVDMDTDASPISPASPVSRASSIRSVGSSTSAVPPSLSRASSMSVRIVDGHHHHQHDDEDGANAALLRDASLRKFRARVRGTRPALRLEPGRVCLDERDGEMGVRVRVPRVAGEDVDGEGSEESEGGLLRASLTRKPSGKSAGRLVAVKMTARRVPRTAAAVPASVAGAGVHGSGGSRRERERERLRVLDRQRRREEEERTRVRFVREVEVLKVGRLSYSFSHFGFLALEDFWVLMMRAFGRLPQKFCTIPAFEDVRRTMCASKKLACYLPEQTDQIWKDNPGRALYSFFFCSFCSVWII
ncbi:hypothetical protein BDN70DRAFT_28386 [Pholiota conissans]|uniref:Protein kinase domain-containing protein n=1 Tax=Pholiota conissans TaxID=109636 RepID=A0A9P5ZC40_9AGAR|nr:hypothetical protein BDN70DRAFT_28386 [Pholiota conissans]